MQMEIPIHSLSAFSTQHLAFSTQHLAFLRAPYVREGELNVRLSIVLVLLQREGDVERGLVLGEVIVSLGAAPGDRAEDPAVLPERHLEMPLFELPGTI